MENTYIAHKHRHTSVYFCTDFLIMPPYTQLGLLCVGKTEVISVKRRSKQLAKWQKKRKAQRGGKRHERDKGRKGKSEKHKEKGRCLMKRHTEQTDIWRGIWRWIKGTP